MDETIAFRYKLPVAALQLDVFDTCALLLWSSGLRSLRKSDHGTYDTLLGPQYPILLL
jgi:hypothetical protein